MSDPAPANTDPNTPPANTGEPAPAPAEPVVTAPANNAEPVSDPNAKLQSQRDKLQNKVSMLESFLEPIAVERAVDSFLSENKDKYPDLTRDDLMNVSDISPEYLDKEAARLQTRLQEHAQKKILEIENPKVPDMTLDERNAEIDKLRNSKDPNAFQKMLRLRQAA